MQREQIAALQYLFFHGEFPPLLWPRQKLKDYMNSSAFYQTFIFVFMKKRKKKIARGVLVKGLKKIQKRK